MNVKNRDHLNITHSITIMGDGVRTPQAGPRRRHEHQTKKIQKMSRFAQLVTAWRRYRVTTRVAKSTITPWKTISR